MWSCLPGQRTVPTIWVAPVRSHCMPITISWFAVAGAACTPVKPIRTSKTISRSRMIVVLSSRTSVREWPDPEVVANVPPESVQPLRLHDEEKDDESAEHHESQVGDEVHHGLRLEEHAPEGLHAQTDDDGEQGDEHGAEDRAQNRAQPSHDDHGEVVDVDVDLEPLVVGDADEVGEEHAGDAGIEGRDREGQELVAEDVDADDLGGDVLVADGDEGAPHPAAHEVEGGDNGEHHESQEEEVQLPLAGERDAA